MTALPLLTADVHDALCMARRASAPSIECSLDLGRSVTKIELLADSWRWRGERYPFLESCKERTVYFWSGSAFEPAARYTTSLIKLVPTQWGPPTFEIASAVVSKTTAPEPITSWFGVHDASASVNASSRPM